MLAFDIQATIDRIGQDGFKTYTLHGIVKVAHVDQLAIEKAVVGPAQLLGALLVDKQPRAELLGLDRQETSELLEVHGCVQPEVGLHGRAPHVGLDFVHENGQVVLDGIHVGLRVVKVRRNGRDELGARRPEELLIDGKRLGATPLQLQELVTELLTKSGVDGVVKTSGMESHADGNEGQHLVVLLGDRVVLSVLLEVLGTRDVDQDVAEHADGIGVATDHHVGETDVVVGCEVRGHDAGEHGLLVQLDVVKRPQGEAEVTKQTVHTEKTNDGEVSQHPVQTPAAVVTCNSHRVLVALHCLQLLEDLRALNERVEHVQDTVASPRVGVLSQYLRLLLVVGLPCDAHPV